MELYLNQMQNERYEIEVTRSYSKKQGTSYHRYCNDILTFDIETTSAWLENGKIKGYETGHDNEYWNNLTPLALCYIWQFSFNDKVYSLRLALLNTKDLSCGVLRILNNHHLLHS